MDGDALHAPLRRQVDQREQVLVHRVNAAGADQAEDVQRTMIALRELTGLDERGIIEKGTTPDGLVDPHEVLHDHAAGPEVQVADFAVSHLPLRQSNSQSRRLEQGARRAGPQSIPGRRVGECDRVSLPRFAISPSVEHDEHDGAALRHSATISRRSG
jgi:hypothetical protein